MATLAHKSNHHFAYHSVQITDFFLSSSFHIFTLASRQKIYPVVALVNTSFKMQSAKHLSPCWERECVYVCEREWERRHASKTDMKFQAHYFRVRVCLLLFVGGWNLLWQDLYIFKPLPRFSGFNQNLCLVVVDVTAVVVVVKVKAVTF